MAATTTRPHRSRPRYSHPVSFEGPSASWPTRPEAARAVLRQRPRLCPHPLPPVSQGEVQASCHGSICPGIFCSAGIFCTCKTNRYSLYIEVRPELEVSRGARCDSCAPPAAVRRVGARRPCWPRDAARHGAANSAIQQTAMPQNGVLVSMREQQGSCATEGVLPVPTGPRDPWGLPAAVRRAVRRLNTGSWVAAAPGNTAIRQNGKSPERQYGGTAATIPWMAGPRS